MRALRLRPRPEVFLQLLKTSLRMLARGSVQNAYFSYIHSKTIGPARRARRAQLVIIPYHGWWPVGLWLLTPVRICQSTSRCRYAYYNMYSDLHPTSYLPALARLVLTVLMSDLLYNIMYMVNILESTVHHKKSCTIFNSSMRGWTYTYHAQSSW